MELNPRAKRWIGTIQNYDEHVVIRLEDLLMDSDKIKYGCYGKEIAPTTGTPHLHFFIHFRAAIRRNTVKTLIGSCWLDVARGSLKAIIEYIQKDGQFKEFGEKPIQTEEELQKIKDIKKMLEELMNLSWEEFETKYPVECYRNYNKLTNYKFRHQKINDPWNGELKFKNIWLWGAPGTGKSRWAHNQRPSTEIYKKNVNKWWDGYDNSTTKLVLIEDFPIDNKDWLINIMKIWSDRYAFNGEIKGGTVYVEPGRWYLIVTSNHSIDEVFQGAPEDDRNAIKRRFTEIELKIGSIVNWARVQDAELINA